MKRTIVLALLALLPFLASAAGTATVRVTNAGSVPITIAGQTIRPSATASIPVPAGEAGAFAAVAPGGFGIAAPAAYPSLRVGATFSLRLAAERGAVSFSPVSLPSASAAAPSAPTPVPSVPTSASKMCFVPAEPLVPNPVRANKGAMSRIRSLADATLDGVDTMIDCYEIKDDKLVAFKEMYEAVSPYFGKEEYEMIMRRVDARHPNELWVPRSASTVFGSVNRVLDIWGTVEDAATVGKIGEVMARGFLEGKSASEVVDDLVDSGVGTSDKFGEAAYWAAAIAVGMHNGRSFTESIEDAFDSDTAGIWTKIGYGWGHLTAKAVIGFRKFMNRGERARLEETMLRSLRQSGYGEEAERAFRAWLALDDDMRAITPFRLKDEWKVVLPDFSTLERLVDEQIAYVRGLLAAGQKATREQFDEFNSLSDRYGKEFDRLRAEIFAMADEVRKRECLQRLMAVNERIVKELDPLLDQAERKGLFKNLSSGSSVSSPAPHPTPAPKPAHQAHPCIPCWTGDLVGTCSDPKCPNYGNPHRQYKGGGMPNFGDGLR